MERFQESTAGHSGPGIGKAIGIWVILLTLTAATVLVHGVRLIFPGIIVAILIAAAKSYLVLEYYMHLKYESPVLRRFVWMTLGILVTILIYIFIDPAYR